MNDNRYSPPAAEVADGVGADADAPARPQSVNYALYLIGGGLLLQFLEQLRGLQQAGFQIENLRITALSVGWFLVGALLCHQLAQGKGWPRIVLLIVTAGNFATTAYGLGFALRRSPELLELFSSELFLLNRAVPLLMNLAALHLLYFSGGNWFREPR